MKKLLIILISLIMIVGTVCGYVLYQKSRLHVNVSNISEQFVKRANKNESYLYAKRKRLDPIFNTKYTLPISNIEIDVVIPIVEKDLEVVVYTIESIKKLVTHKIGKIYLVGPNQQKIKDFALVHQCEFVEEDKVLPFPEIKKYGNSIVKKFVKLNMDNVVQKDHYLVIDADTIFLRPAVFNKKNIYLINVQRDIVLSSKKIISKILNNKKVYVYDFASNHMLISKKVLNKMKEHIEKIHNDEWYSVVLKSFEKDQDNTRNFSELELYTTYLTEFTKEKIKFVSNANITIYQNFLESIDRIIPAYAGEYKTLNVHNYIYF